VVLFLFSGISHWDNDTEAAVLRIGYVCLLSGLHDCLKFFLKQVNVLYTSLSEMEKKKENINMKK